MPVAIKAPTVLSLQADKVFTWFIGTQNQRLHRSIARGRASRSHVEPRLYDGRAQFIRLGQPLPPLLKEVNQRPNRTASITHFRIDLRRGARPHSMAFKDAAGFACLTFNISSITYGAMLGVFLRGILAIRCSDRGNLISMPSGSLTYTTLSTLIETRNLALGWTWLTVIDTAWNCGLRCLWHEKAPRSE
jgi:hypothetical protein